MANPEIVYDSRTLAFPQTISEMERRRVGERKVSVSASGKAGSVFEHAFDEVEIEMDVFDDRDFYRDLQPWWAWAAQGNEYAFALDSADKIDTTLDGAAAAGQKVIPLTSTTGIQVGTKYRVRSDDATKEEIIEVASINAGVSVTAVDSLVWAYASGDFFRSEDYFPAAVSLDDEFPARETSFGGFEFKHKFREVK
jgi:hypothetical protein